MKKRILTMVGLFLMVSPLFLLAEDNEPKWVKPGAFFDNNIQFSLNKLGFAIESKLFYRMPLVKKNGLLWKSTKTEFGLYNMWSPSFERVGVMLTLEPIALFDLKATAVYDYAYPALGFGGLYPLATADAPHDTASRKAATPNPDSIGGWRINVSPTLKAQVGPVVVTHTFTYVYLNYAYSGFYYDHEFDLAVSGEDSLLVNDSKLLFKIKDVMTGFQYKNVYVASSGIHQDTLAAMAVYIPTNWKMKPGVQPFGVLQLGTHFQDQNYRYKFYVGTMVGLSWKIM